MVRFRNFPVKIGGLDYKTARNRYPEKLFKFNMQTMPSHERALSHHQVDLMICPRWMIPVIPDDTILENHALVVDQGQILDLLPIETAMARYSARTTEELPEHVLIPGLVNTHTHAAMALLRGIADDLPLKTWLEDWIWPLETRWVSTEMVRDGTLLACAEMLQAGITTFNDMYFFPEAVCAAAREVGLRVVAGLVAVDFPTPYAPDATSALERGWATRQAFAGEPLVHFALAPHAPYTVGDELFLRLAKLAREEGLRLHCHVHETTAEIAGSLETHGERPLARLERLGVLGPGFIAVHCVHLDANDIAMLAGHRVHVAHCPASNLKLASGFAPTAALRAAGVNVGLGTDSAASNNRLDLFGELRLAALLAKGATGDATVWDATEALRAATLGGAEALGLADEIGSLESGKSADLLAVDLSHPSLQPVFDPCSHLVHVAGREQVREVWVAGQRRVRQGQLVSGGGPGALSGTALQSLAREWADRLRSTPVT